MSESKASVRPPVTHSRSASGVPPRKSAAFRKKSFQRRLWKVPGTKSFTDRYPFFGPSMWMLAIVFFIAQIAVAFRWKALAARQPTSGPYDPYNLFANTISDLGVTSKFVYGHPTIWSPDHFWMNASLIMLGGLMIAGSLTLYQEFTETSGWKVLLAKAGFGCQGIAGAGAIAVGLIPENSWNLGHEVGAGMAIVVGTFGVFLLGFALPLPGALRGFMLWCSPVSLVAILLYALHKPLGFGDGGLERIAAYPEVIWLIRFGFYISRSHFAFGSAHRMTPAYPTAVPGNGQRLRLAARGWLPIGRVNQRYSAPVKSLGGAPAGPRRYVLATPGRAGLRLSTSGVLSGIPDKWGLTRIVVEVDDGHQTVSKAFSLFVRP